MFSRWFLILGSIMLSIAVFMQVPQFLHQIRPEAQGIMVHLNSDEYAYLARVQEGLSGRPEQAAEAIVGDPEIQGLQAGLIEKAYGVLFQWTGWRAATLLQVMDSVMPPLLFLAIWFFFVLCGFTRVQALVGAMFFILINLYGLNRPIYQRASALLVLLSFIGVLMGLKKHWGYGVLGGVLLGVLPAVYFWSWTYAWAWFGLLFLWTLFEKEKRKEVHLLFFFGLVCLVTSAPFFWDMWQLSHHPLYEIGVFRSGIHHARMPESVPYSILFLMMSGGVLGTLFTKKELRCRFSLVAITILTSFIVINQQLIHGITFNFVSHYLFLLAISAVMVLVFVCESIKWCRPSTPLRTTKTVMVSGVEPMTVWLLIALIGSLVYLSALTYDGRYIFKQFQVDPASFSEQHFASALPILDALPRATILSDNETSHFIAGATKHDVVYSVYLKNVLMTHEELAERLCLTTAALPTEERHFEEWSHLIYPDAVSAFRDPVVRAREVELVESSCELVDSDPQNYIENFHVDYILWDEERHPTWNLTRLRVPLTLVEQGEGWSLWEFE